MHVSANTTDTMSTGTIMNSTEAAFIEQSLQTSEKHLRDIDQEIAEY